MKTVKFCSRFLLLYSALLLSSCAVRWQGRELISVKPLGHVDWSVGKPESTNTPPSAVR